ncbi:AI-2E family transporter [Methylosinus sp. Sm6]|uniref:AI-2E family transporter n=1 Tax=Methylosinus sp. Sm6 TaxID=2866948 RepID=UPI001C9A1C14|nr:AI-2E family transporter [Methylosinus sp. Sm6]MBY6242093.1 AI-2E family transporter [Methylosinus sp. Sm6]
MAETANAAGAALLIFLTLVAAHVGQTVVEPIVFAIFIIALMFPLQTALEMRLPRWAALLVTVACALAVAITLSSLIVWGGGELVDWFAQNLERVKTSFEASTKWLEAHDVFVGALITEHANAGWMLGVVREAATRFNVLAGFALVVFVYVVMGLAETSTLKANIAAATNEDTASRLLRASARIAQKFHRYMLVRTVASLTTGALVFLFALAIGLERAAAWGVLSFALNYLPYIGSLVVTILPALFAYVQYDSAQAALLVLGALGVIQLVIGSGIEPVFSGTALAMSPTVVVFAVLLWTFLWGLPGAFIGVPIAIAVLTLCEHFPSTRWIARIAAGEAPRDTRDDGV